MNEFYMKLRKPIGQRSEYASIILQLRNYSQIGRNENVKNQYLKKVLETFKISGTITYTRYTRLSIEGKCFWLADD